MSSDPMSEESEDRTERRISDHDQHLLRLDLMVEDLRRREHARSGRRSASDNLVLVAIIALVVFATIVVLLLFQPWGRDARLAVAPTPLPTPTASTRARPTVPPTPESSVECRIASAEPVACPNPTPSASPPSIALFADVSVAEKALRYVPADGVAATILVVRLTDRNHEPAPDRPLRLVAVAACANPCPPAFEHVTVRPERFDAGGQTVGEATTDSHGVARFRLSGTVAGAVALEVEDEDPETIVSTTSDTIQLTRKIVLLAMGMNSELGKRFCYWGTGTQGSSVIDPVDCSDRAQKVIGSPTTVIGALTRLGYRYSASAGDSHPATMLDVSWASTPCPSGNERQCVAVIDTTGTAVTWKALDFSIKHVGSLLPQANIDAWAARLVNTLGEFDKALWDHEGVHASFYLVGHSMGGQLVTRAIAAANEGGRQGQRVRFTADDERGKLRLAMAIDGSLNWKLAAWPPVWIRHVDDRKLGCGLIFQVPYNAGRRENNIAAVKDAYEHHGTQLVAITNIHDRIVPQLVATLGRENFTEAGDGNPYVERLYSHDGSDRRCAHSSLIWFEPGEPVTDRQTGLDELFPIDGLLRQYIGRASDQIAPDAPRASDAGASAGLP